MTDTIFTTAATLRSMIAERGLWAGELSTSTNRNGDSSAYFEIAGGSRIRVSDHSCNSNFRVAEINWYGGIDSETVDRFVADRKAEMVECRVRYDQHLAEVAETKKARMDAFAAEQAKTAANNALLASLGHDAASMTKNQRKKALSLLRRGA